MRDPLHILHDSGRRWIVVRGRTFLATLFAPDRVTPSLEAEGDSFDGVVKDLASRWEWLASIGKDEQFQQKG